ncbi:MAG: DUF763 domain-containing protein [Candidatus Aenigmatarchaeota archaeon]
MKRTGIVDLPLHSGHAPRWLFEKMVRISESVSELIILEYGQKEFLKRLSNPFWFQSFACAIGFDWHSSGTTTTACGALKIALSKNDLGIKIVGGKGKTAKNVEKEINSFDFLNDKKIEKLKYASKMTAKIDNACVQDSYNLYHHCMIFSEKGDWTVIQQGMNDKYARRYHWFSENVKSFVEEPHTGIIGDRKEENVLDTTSKENKELRKASVEIVNDANKIIKQITRQSTLNDFNNIQFIKFPEHHELPKNLNKETVEFLKKTNEIQPKNYEELVSLNGVGPAKIRALALLSELIFGVEVKWKDPLKYTFAHGGKDGHPYPVDKETYEDSINFLKDAIRQAKLNEYDKINALKRLNKLSY